MKKTRMLLTAVCVLTFAVSGCATAKPETKAPEFVPISGDMETQSLATATRFGNGFYTALQSGDYAPLRQVLPPELPDNPEKFVKMRADLLRIYGTPAEFTYLNVVRNGKVRDYLWRITFVMPEKVVPPAKPVQQPCDVVWGVRVCCEKGKTPQVAGSYFMPFAMPRKNR